MHRHHCIYCRTGNSRVHICPDKLQKNEPAQELRDPKIEERRIRQSKVKWADESDDESEASFFTARTSASRGDDAAKQQQPTTSNAAEDLDSETETIRDALEQLELDDDDDNNSVASYATALEPDGPERQSAASTEGYILSNNISTSGGRPTDKMTVTIVTKQRELALQVPRRATGKELYAAARRALGKQASEQFQLVHFMHQVVSDSDCELWHMHFRHRSNFVALMSDIQRGDTYKLRPFGKGNNDNRGHIPQRQRSRDRSS